jgi:hypothetical protein
MPEPTSPVAAERPAEPLVYRPISGLAIAGIIFATLFAGLVLFSVIVFLVRREPFYLPTWMYLLGIAGLVLSFLALRQIRASEGTRAGIPLARLGLWLSVLCVLGSWVFSLVTGRALYQQANRFLTEKGPDAGFFPLLEQGNVNAAFLLTQRPDARRQANPNSDRDMEKFFDNQEDPKDPRGRLTFFRGVDFVRLLGQHGTANELEPLGNSDWKYETNSYVISRTYQIRNPEGVFELPLRIQSIESSVPGEGRKWMVVWGPMHPPVKEVKLTALGEKLLNLRGSAAIFGSVWLEKLASGELASVYAGMIDPAQRAKLNDLHVMQLQVAAASMLTAAPGDPRPLLRSNLYQAVALVTGSRGGAPKGDAGPVVAPHLRVRGGDLALQQAVESAAARLGRGTERILRGTPHVKPEQARYARWQKKDGRLEIALDVIFDIHPFPDRPAEVATVIGKLILAADAEADPARPPDQLWHVVRLEFDRALSRSLNPIAPAAGRPPMPGTP